MYARSLKRGIATYPRLTAPAALATTPAPSHSRAVLGSVSGLQEYAKELGCASSLVQDLKNAKGPCITYGSAGDQVAFFKLAEDSGATAATAVRSGAASAVKALQPFERDGLDLVCVDSDKDSYAAAARTALLANYHFDKYLTGEDKPHLFASISVPSGAIDSATTQRLQAIADATCFARDIVNERADVMGPNGLEAVALGIAQSAGMTMKVIKGAEVLAKEELGLLQAVGQGATEEPRIVLLEYHGGQPTDPWDVVLGKGITFDTGGLNLKPTNFIEDMHMDMGGAGAVLGAAHGIAKLRPRRNIVFALGIAENAIGPLAYKPHAIIKSRKGLTVQVNNTDAEGRLVLADTMTYVQQKYTPKSVVELSTLTGACVVALGECAAGLFTEQEALRSSLMAASSAANELLHPLPLYPQYTEELKGDQADLNSTGQGREAGACTAAAFLHSFKEKDVAFAHVDIAGPAMRSKPQAEFPKGGTGFGTGFLLEYLTGSEQGGR